jgi:hypothetical protein
MREAVARNPGLCADDGDAVARLAAGWANHVKTAEPLAFLAAFYDHLPEELGMLRKRRRRELAREALQLGFAAYRQQDTGSVRSRLWQAIGYDPRVLLNRGVLSMLLGPGGSAGS